jgi:hypothetical protein
MSDSNKGIFFAIGGAVLLAVIAGAVYFLVIAPRAERKEVQAEVVAWGESWDGARDCLVGPDPRSSDGYEAMVLREALATEDIMPELVDCAEELKLLRRGEGYSAGADAEKAWEELQKKVTALAEAHAWRVAKTPNRPVPELRRALAVAVADLDQAYARLRDKAELDPAHPAGKRLPSLPAGRVMTDPRGTPIAPQEVGVSGRFVYAIGAIGDRKWLLRGDGSGTPQVIPLGVETLAGLDGTGWGVWGEGSEEEGTPFEIRSGPLDPVGDPSGDGVLIATLKKGESADVLLAIGNPQARVVVYRTANAETETGADWIARSRDGGATWPERVQLTTLGPDRPAGVSIAPNLALQRADITFTGADRKPRWLVVDASTLDRPFAPVAIETPGTAPCVAGPRTWWLGDDDTVYHSEGPGKPLDPVPGSSEGAHTLICGGERLLAIADAAMTGLSVLVCRAAGCTATTIPAAPAARTAAALSEKRGPMVANEAEGVVVIWSGDPEKNESFKPVEMARLAGDQQLAGLVEWNGALQLVTRTEKTLHIVPLE